LIEQFCLFSLLFYQGRSLLFEFSGSNLEFLFFTLEFILVLLLELCLNLMMQDVIDIDIGTTIRAGNGCLILIHVPLT